MGGTASAPASSTAGHPVPRTPEQKAVLTAWVSFQVAMTKAINQQTIDVEVLDAVSTGNWRHGLLKGIAERYKKRQYTVGQAVVEVRVVRVDGNTASVEYCQDDRSYEVDIHGKTAAPPPGIALVSDDLVLVGGKWLGSNQSQNALGGCTIRGGTP